MRLIIWLFILTFMAGCASSGNKPVVAQNAEPEAEQLEAGLTAKHPAAYLQLAGELFEQGDKDRAALMYYVGQIRYRAYINTLPVAEAAAEEARYKTLQTAIGDEINQYAARNLDKWIKLLDNAVAWHKQHPNEFLPKADYSLLYELTIYNFNKLRKYITENKEYIRTHRTAQGLVNEF